MAQRGGGRQYAVSLFGLVLFLLTIPFFLQMGGGRWLLSEVLPGQAAASRLNLQALWMEQDGEAGAHVWGVDDVEFQQKNKHGAAEGLGITPETLEKMKDFSYLKSNFYIIDSRTALLEEDINAEQALSMDFTITPSEKEPKILLFHTHAHEGFADSDMTKGLDQGICGVGEELKRILEDEYGIGVLHHMGQYDVVNGKGQITGAYERIEPAIDKLLAQYPSIEVCIDMHRDGVGENTRLIAEVDGETTAQIMLFNGLCRLNQNGQLSGISGLENPYVKDNLAFSLQLQMAAAEEFPGFTRKIYLNPYRFILHKMPRSTLIEVGAQTNTRQEAMNAMKPLAKMLAKVLLEEE